MLSTFYDTKLCQRHFFSTASLRGELKGEKQHMLSLMSRRSDGPLRSYQIFWCAEWQNKINRERKAVKDLQCSALINEGLYQLGAHDWCVNISAVTQFGTPLFTEHKDHKQALATNTLPSVNSWAFKNNLWLLQRSQYRS